MDYDKLIERLYKHHTDWGEGRTQDFFKVELAAANERFPQFHSQHEGYAVILEEAEELDAEVKSVGFYIKEAWEYIKGDESLAESEIKCVWQHAINAACEAIQVAAMAQKFLEMENGKKG